MRSIISHNIIKEVITRTGNSAVFFESPDGKLGAYFAPNGRLLRPFFENEGNYIWREFAAEEADVRFVPQTVLTALRAALIGLQDAHNFEEGQKITTEKSVVEYYSKIESIDIDGVEITGVEFPFMGKKLVEKFLRYEDYNADGSWHNTGLYWFYELV